MKKSRIIDFRRDKLDMPATVQRIEYDPNREAEVGGIARENKDSQC